MLVDKVALVIQTDTHAWDTPGPLNLGRPPIGVEEEERACRCGDLAAACRKRALLGIIPRGSGLQLSVGGCVDLIEAPHVPARAHEGGLSRLEGRVAGLVEDPLCRGDASLDGGGWRARDMQNELHGSLLLPAGSTDIFAALGDTVHNHSMQYNVMRLYADGCRLEKHLRVAGVRRGTLSIAQERLDGQAGVILVARLHNSAEIARGIPG